MRYLAAFLLTLSAPTVTRAHAEGPPICTDRPSKANAACTVPAGRLQLETNAIGWSLTEAGENRTELFALVSSFAKLGLTDRSDLQIGFTPFAKLTSRTGDDSDSVSGFGDILVRYKHRLTGEGAPVQLAIIPFMKLPTAAEGLGNDKVEAGLAVPISFALAGPVTMTFGPELDLLTDADGDGRHLALVNLVNLSLPVTSRLTLIGELWTNLNFDPAETGEQASVDAALAYAVSNDLQFDIGANVGLTATTPDLELYTGLSVRF